MPQSIQSLSQRKDHTTSDNHRRRKHGEQKHDHARPYQHDGSIIDVGHEDVEDAEIVLQRMSRDVDRYHRFVVNGETHRLNETAQARDHEYRHEHVLHGYRVVECRHLRPSSDPTAFEIDGHDGRHSFDEDLRRRAMHHELGWERARTPKSTDTEPPTSAPPSLENSLVIDFDGESRSMMLQHVNGWNELGRRECDARYASVIDEEDVKSEVEEANQ